MGNYITKTNDPPTCQHSLKARVSELNTIFRRCMTSYFTTHDLLPEIRKIATTITFECGTANNIRFYISGEFLLRICFHDEQDSKALSVYFNENSNTPRIIGYMDYNGKKYGYLIDSPISIHGILANPYMEEIRYFVRHILAFDSPPPIKEITQYLSKANKNINNICTARMVCLMIIHARNNNDSTFIILPKDIIQIICKFIFDQRYNPLFWIK